MARQMRGAVAAFLIALTTCACTTSVSGRAIRAPEQSPPGGSTSANPSPGRIPARDLLLQDGDSTPFGVASAVPVGATYFTSVQPTECAAAMLFKGSPLPPARSADHAESEYKFSSQALYAESADVYDKKLNAHDVVWKGFGAVAKCHGDAIGHSSLGDFRPMRLKSFGTPSSGVLVWTMTRPDWTCDYGLVVVPRIALMLSACDVKPGFPMADWAAKRRAQLDSRPA
ncbi:hypothetical protein AWC05_19025 [Mycobacterium florentinum]|uniref:PknH-like extracellular domain-containing protein n=1 Tax=Mycobacterium florentinum TaxID=292462 RepID=A0A1X1UAW1_MYCFL|nr:hypothetical protein [Mycobacterium florentinum]ORV53819.1 hypothetical protein AWC05_19025 [Mycobacterium florentinum]